MKESEMAKLVDMVFRKLGFEIKNEVSYPYVRIDKEVFKNNVIYQIELEQSPKYLDGLRQIKTLPKNKSFVDKFKVYHCGQILIVDKWRPIMYDAKADFATTIITLEDLEKMSDYKYAETKIIPKLSSNIDDFFEEIQIEVNNICHQSWKHNAVCDIYSDKPPTSMVRFVQQIRKDYTGKEKLTHINQPTAFFDCKINKTDGKKDATDCWMKIIDRIMLDRINDISEHYKERYEKRGKDFYDYFTDSQFDFLKIYFVQSHFENNVNEVCFFGDDPGFSEIERSKLLSKWFVGFDDSEDIHAEIYEPALLPFPKERLWINHPKLSSPNFDFDSQNF